MAKAVSLFLIFVFVVAMVDSKPFSEAEVECNQKLGGCDPEEINPRPKRHIHCLFFPHLCMPQYVPAYYPAQQVSHTYNIVNGNGTNNSIIFNG